jgi:protein-L-isoaspartate O-methyltransferase
MPRKVSAVHVMYLMVWIVAPAGGRMVIPVGLPDAQQLVVADKDLNGRVGTKEIMRVMFSLLEGSDQPTFRPS